MNENLSDVDRQLNDYLSGKSGRMPNLTGDDRSEALKGAVAGYHQLKGLGYGVTGLLGDVTGWEGLKKWGVEGYQSAMEDAGKYQASVPDITRARTAGEVADWMMYYIPNAMVSTMPTIAAGGVPGLVAKAGGKKFVEKAATELVKQGIGKTAAKEMAQAQLAKRVQNQMLGTTLGTGTAMSAGGIYGDTGDAAVALAHAPVAGALEAFAPLKILDRAGLGKVAREGIGDSIGKAIRKGALEEAGTEGLQSLVEQHASHWVASNGESLLQNMDAVDWRELINSSLAGAGAGGTFSGMAGIPTAMEGRRMNKASDEELAGAVDGFDKRIQQVVQAKNEAIARGHDTKILSEQIDNLKLQRDKVNQILASRNQGGLNLGEAVDITGRTPAEDIVPAPVGTQGVSGRQPVNLGAPLDITSPYNASIAGAAQEAMQAEAAKGGDALTQAIAGSRAAGAAQEANADRIMQNQTGGYQATGMQQPSLTYGDQQLENNKLQVQQQIADLNEQFESGAIDFDQYADMTMDLDSMSRLLDQQSKGAAPAIPDMTQPAGAPMGAARGAYGTGLGTVPQGTAMEETLRASTGTGAKGVLARRQLAGSEKWIPPTEVVPEEAPIPEPEPQQPTPVTPQAGQPKPQLPQKTVPYSVIDIVNRHKQRMANRGYDVNWQNLQQGKGSELRRLQKQLEQRRKLQQLSNAEQEVLDVLDNWQAEQPEIGQIPQPTVTGEATGELTLPTQPTSITPPELAQQKKGSSQPSIYSQQISKMTEGAQKSEKPTGIYADIASKIVDDSVIGLTLTKRIPNDSVTYKRTGQKFTQTNQTTQSPIFIFKDRPIIVLDVNGFNIPFYQSSGHADKVDVPAGKWYVVPGMSEEGWLNKTGGKLMASNYGSDIIQALAKELDYRYGDLRDLVKNKQLPDTDTVFADVKELREFTNRDFIEVAEWSEQEGAREKVLSNIKRIDEHLRNYLQSIKPQQQPNLQPPKKPPEEPPAGGGKPAEPPVRAKPKATGQPEAEAPKYKNSFNAPIHLIKLAKDNGLDVFNDDSKLFWNSKNDEYWFQYRDTGKRLTDEELTQEIEKSGTEEYQQEVRQAQEEQERQKEENRQRLEKSREARLKRIAKQDEIYQKRAAGEQPWRTRKKAQQQLETWKLQDSHYVELTTYRFDPAKPPQKAYYIKRLPEKPTGLTFKEVTGNDDRTFLVPETLERKDPLTGKVNQLYPTADYEAVDKWTGIKSQKVPGTDLRGWIADPESFASRIEGRVSGGTDYRPKAEAAAEPEQPAAREPVSTVTEGNEPIVNNYPDSWKEGEVIGDYKLATDHGYGNTYRNGFDVSQAESRWHSKFSKEEKDFFESLGGTTSTDGSSYFTWDKYDYVREKLRERAGQAAPTPAIEPANFSETFVVPGDIGGVPTPGEILNTATGRKTTPFPKWDTSTPRKAKNSEKKINEWLMDNAIEEARSRGDDFNLRQFEGNRDNPTVSDRESANEYLFGDQQPQTVKPITKPSSTPEQAAEPRPGLDKMVKAKQEKEQSEVERRQSGHDRMAGKLRDSAREFTGNADGKSLKPLAMDIAEFTIQNKRRLEESDRKALAEKHGVSENIVRSLEGQKFTYDRVLFDSQKLNSKDAEDFLMLNFAKEQVQKEQAQPTAREQRQAKRKRNLIAIDDEIREAGKDLTDALRGSLGTFNSGVNPELAAKIMVHGMKVSALYMRKGAIKFADWADNMLAFVEDQGFSPEAFAPYLKQLYLGTAAEVDDATADQMDDSRTVRAFDVNSLIEPEEAVSAEDRQHVIEHYTEKVIQKTDRNEFGTKFLDASKDAARLSAEKFVSDYVTKTRRDDADNYKTYINENLKDDIVDALMDYRSMIREDKTEPTPEPTPEVKAEPEKTTNLAVFDKVNLNRFQVEELNAGGKGLAGELDPEVVSSLLAMRDNPKVPKMTPYPTGGYTGKPDFIPIGNGISVRGYAMGNSIFQQIQLPNGMIIERELTGKGELYGSFEGNYEQIVEGKGYEEAEKYIREYYASKNKPEAPALPQRTAEPEPAEKPLTGQSISQTGKDMLPASIQAQKEKANRIANKQKKLKTLDEKAENERKEKDARDQLRQMRLKVFAAEDAIDKVIETDDLSHFDEYAELFPKVRNYLQAVVLQPEGQPLTNTGASGTIGKYTIKPFESGLRLTPDEFLVSGTSFPELNFFNKKGLGGVWEKAHKAFRFPESRRAEIIAALQERTGETGTMPATETETEKKHETTEATGDGILGGISTGEVPEVQGGGKTGERGRDHTGEGQQNDLQADGSRRPEPELAGGATPGVQGTDIHGAGGVSESDVGGGRGGRDGGMGGGVRTGGRGKGGDGGKLGTTREGGINTGAADYTISDHADLEGKTFKQTEKYNNNIEAIRLLKELGDRPATAEQQKILSKYVGWGGLKQAFYRPDGSTAKGWETRAAELKALLTPEEYRAAEDSILNAHYTSPSVVLPIYSALDNIGFKHGRILEPSVGTGNFLGLMPSDMRQQSAVVGVELDHITGGIAKKLYPSAKIRAPMDFANFDIAENSYDLLIGNPPFGDVTMTDLKHKDISGSRIHNYFLLKGLKALRPGGVMAVVVSKGFMDSTANQKGRNMMFRDAKLLGAFRLPNEAFKANANTDVTTDILFFQKREESWLDEPDPSENLYRERATFTGADGSTMKINEYFVANPDNMLGDMIMNDGRYGPGQEPALAARQGLDWKAELEKRARQLVEQAVYQPRKNPVPSSIAVQADDSHDINNAEIGGLYLNDKGELWRREPDVEGDRQGIPVKGYENDKSKFIEFKPNQVEKIKAALQLARTARKLINLQVTDMTDPELEPLRQQMNSEYDAFVKKYKALNRPDNKRILGEADPTVAPMLMALEGKYKKEKRIAGKVVRKESATKADIFTRRTQQPYRPVTKVASSDEGLIVALAESGRVDIDRIAKLTGHNKLKVVADLEGKIFNDPQSGWQTRDEYLSGNVKLKLRQAKEAGRGFEENVKALEAVQPKDIPANEIVTTMGASWQTPEAIQDFYRHLGGGESEAGFEPTRNFWSFRSLLTGRDNNEVKRWSTPDMAMHDLFTAVLNNKPIAVRIKHQDGTSTLDVRATDAAQVKAREIANEFSTWLWRDPQRRDAMMRRYNDLINTNVNRQFDGSFLSFPGKISDDIIKLRRTQANAVWRILQSKSTLLDHVVGAGKTFTVIASVMEMRRMNIARKPMVVVPNHLVAQWAEDFYKLYPNARILAATKKDFATGRRQELFSRIATGDWDAVIVAHSSFGKIPNDPQAEQAFLDQQLQDLNTAIENLREMEGKDTRSVRDAVNQRNKLKEKIKKLLENTGKDTGINWKETGVDALFVDEAHEFKNLEFFTSMNRVKNINPQGSDKAMNLFIKIRSLMEKTGGRNVVFATGTPISNSMAELYTMQRYLAYEQLTDSGLSHFDAWARTFGEIDTRQERKPSGKFGPVSRFSKFVNLPELMRMYRMFADKINNADIIAALQEEGKGKHIPKIKGGKPQPVVAPRSLYQEAYMSEIERRFENMPDDPRIDNPLKATNDARKAGLDMRMVYPELPDYPDSKINKAVDNMMRLYHDWAGDKGTQLVFCDLSTPKSSKAKDIADFRKMVEEAAADDDSDRKRQIKTMSVSDLYDYLQDMADSGNKKAISRFQKVSPDDVAALETDFDVYNDIKEKLIGRGVPADEIAFIHNYNTDLQKEELFSKVNNGEIRFLLGSTAKMGAGTNVQERLVGLHHMDAPWRPSDLEQREGRIIRQGNSLFLRDPDGFEVEILRYATEMTYDVNMWQTLEVKARFIEQIRNGDTEQRTADDVAGESASAAEMKAASSGDPRIMELVDIQARLRVLDSLRQVHRYEVNTATMQLDKYRDEIDYLPDYIQSLQEDQDRIQPVRQDGKGKDIPDFAGLGGKRFKTRKAGEDYIKKTILDAVKNRNDPLWNGAKVGTYRGFDVVAQLDEFSVGDLVNATEVSMYLTGNRDYEIFRSDIEKTGWNNVINRFNRFLDGDETRYPYIESQVAQTNSRLQQAKKDLAATQERSQEKFKYEDEYQQKTARNQQLMEELGSEREANKAAETLPEYWALVKKAEDYADVRDMPIHKTLEAIAYRSRIRKLVDSVLYSKPGYEQKAADAALKKAKEQGITIRPEELQAAKVSAESARKRQAEEAAREQQTTNKTPAPAGVSGSGAVETDIPAFLQLQTLGFGDDLPASTGKARMGRQAVEATIRGFKRKYPGLKNLNIRVLKDTTELPQLYRPGEPLENRSNQGAAFIPGNNTVYIFADNVHSPADINTILQHETFAHFAIDSLPEAERQSFIDQIHAAVQADPELREIWREVSRTYEGYSRRTQAEEVVARIAEGNPQAMSALRRLWWHIRKLYRQHFNGALPLKHWEVAGFVSEFARRVEAGTYQPSASESRNYGALPEGTLVGAPAYFRRNKDGSNSFTIKGAADQAGRFFNGQSYAENELVKQAGRSARTARDMIRKGGLQALGGRQITDMYAKYVEPLAKVVKEDGVIQILGNPIKNYQKYLQNMQALANNKAHEANDIDIEWGKLATQNPVDYESVSDLMHQTTIYEVKPYEAFTPFADMDKLEHKRDLLQDELSAGHDVDDAEDVKRYEDLQAQYQRIAGKIKFEQERDRIGPQLVAQYNKLGDKAKTIYKDVEKYYQDMWQETHDALVANVERNVNDGNDRRAFLDFLKTMFASNQVRGPYFPLKRHGDFFIVAEDENGERYREHFETLGAMEKGLEDLESQGFTILKSGKKTQFNAQDAAGVSQFAGKLYEAMNGPAFAHITPEVRFQMQEEINQAVLQMLPEVSAAKSQIRRKKIKGYSQNARRSFAFTAIHSANRLARITYADRMQAEIKRIEDDIDSHNTDGVIPHKDIPMLASVVDEMKLRHETIINPNGSPWAAAATNAAFIWYLGASAGAGLVNMTQTPLIALPLLGSRFGYRKSGKAFLKATADYAKYSKKRLTLRKSMMTLSEAESGISADEKAMIDELVRDGTIETTQAHTLSGIADTDVRPHMQKNRERWDKVMRITGVFFHNAEVANREVTALAAYRLARDSGKNHDAAMEIARKTVFDSHFDYSGANRPRVMKNNWMKVFTIFKQYSQNMTYLLASNAATMLTLSKTPKADRIAAFKALAGILFGHATMAGTLGLPLMSFIGPALAAAFGDEDDEFRDWETMYRNWLADLFGKEGGHAIAKGVVNGFMGRDLHSRISLNDIWIRSPNYEMSAREESMHYMMQALGPAVGAGINFVLGVDQVAQGQTLKGIEKMMPKFIRDGIRTYRYSTEGATVGREGYQAMIEDFSAGEVIWQGLGISPARLSEAYGARSSVMNMEKRIKQARGDLMRDYYRASRESDYDAMRRIMGEIQQFNQANPMFRIKNLAQSMRTRRRYEQMSESGIYLPYQQRGLLNEARYAL